MLFVCGGKEEEHLTGIDDVRLVVIGQIHGKAVVDRVEEALADMLDDVADAAGGAVARASRLMWIISA